MAGWGSSHWRGWFRGGVVGGVAYEPQLLRVEHQGEGGGVGEGRGGGVQAVWGKPSKIMTSKH